MQIIFSQLYIDLYLWYKRVLEQDFHCSNLSVHTESNTFQQKDSKPVILLTGDFLFLTDAVTKANHTLAKI